MHGQAAGSHGHGPATIKGWNDMKVLVLDRTLNENYGSFARSFTRIRAEYIKSELDEKLVASGRYRNASSILGGAGRRHDPEAFPYRHRTLDPRSRLTATRRCLCGGSDCEMS